MSPKREKILRYLLWAFLLVMLGNGVYRAFRENRQSIGLLQAGTPAHMKFIQECAGRIPEEEQVHLVAATYYYHAAAWLYPRPVRLCTLEEARAAAEERPEEWFVTFAIPFDPSTARCTRLRDLR